MSIPEKVESGTWGRHALLAVMRLGFVGCKLCGSETAVDEFLSNCAATRLAECLERYVDLRLQLLRRVDKRLLAHGGA
jgi:hypothetical protein